MWNDDDRICKNCERGHIGLTCKNHPNLTWSTKNISHIGARSIFFFGAKAEDGKDRDRFVAECDCSGRDLIHVCPNTQECAP
jgi:hypothetical protein